MRSIYLSEHPFDELEALNNIYKDASHVATLLYPKSDELRKVVEVLINFDNMLSLCSDNYKEYKSNTLALTESQSALIKSKGRAVFKAFNNLQLTSAATDNTVKLLSAIDADRERQQRNREQLERRKDYLILSINYHTKARGIDLYLVKIKGGQMIVGSDGKVSHVDQYGQRSGRFKTQYIDENGDVLILAGSNYTRTYAVFDLVAMCFCNWWKEDVIITHINGDKNDNRPGNLTSVRQI